MKKINLPDSYCDGLFYLITHAFTGVSCQARPAKSNTTPEKKQPSDTPTFVNTVPTPDPAQNKSTENQTETYVKTPEQRIADLTFWLIFVACIQAAILFAQLIAMSIQARRLRETVKATEKAANAAKESADALPTIEKAFMFVTNLEWKPNTDGAKFHAIGDNIIEAILFNGGKTPAILDKVFMTHTIRKEYPHRAEIGKLANVTPDNTIVKSGDSTFATIDITLSQDQWTEMVLHKNKLLCYGRIEYTDIFGKNHETGFCWECANPQGSTLTVSNTKELSYYTQCYPGKKNVDVY